MCLSSDHTMHTLLWGSHLLICHLMGHTLHPADTPAGLRVHPVSITLRLSLALLSGAAALLTGRAS